MVFFMGIVVASWSLARGFVFFDVGRFEDASATGTWSALGL